MPPDETVPLENLTVKELCQRAKAERVKRSEDESMRVRSMDTARPWTGYVVTGEQSGQTYRVALRGLTDGESYCSCPDYRTNRLSACKYILHVQSKVKKRFSAAKLRAPYRPQGDKLKSPGSQAIVTRSLFATARTDRP